MTPPIYGKLLGLGLFLFATNFYVYWMPQFAMAENMILMIFLLGIYLLVNKATLTNSVIAGIVAISFYATKYSAIPILGVFFFLYLFKSNKKTILFYLLSFFIFGLALLAYLELKIHAGTFVSLSYVFKSITTGPSLPADKTAASWFSSVYILKNLKMYAQSLIGAPNRFMWDFTPMLPRWLSILGITGLFGGLFSKKFKFLSTSLISLVASQTLFISSFYSFDNRYIYIAIPALILGVAMLVDMFGKRTRFVIILLIFGTYLFSNAIRLKNQVMLNIKHSEVPWGYISTTQLADYLSSSNLVGSETFVISPLPPYYLDFFLRDKYNLLPLSSEQEFRTNREVTWGDYNYSDLPNTFNSILLSGKTVVVSTYGLGNEAYLHESFDDLSKDFKLTEVADGCYTQCKIYKLELKNAKSY